MMHASTQTAALIEYSGTLLRAAEARTRVLDHDGHMVPVLCMDIEIDNSFRTPLHVEQYFPTGHQVQAQAAAHHYKKGQRVTVQVPLLALRMSGIAAHIHVPKDQQTKEPSRCPL